MSTIHSQLPYAPSLRMSESEFVEWTNNDASAEWVGATDQSTGELTTGEVILKMPVEGDHDEIQALIRQVIESLARRRKLGKVRGPEFTTRLTLKDKVVRRDPDVMFIGNDKLANLKSTVLEGPADLVVEVVSPDSETRDFQSKFNEYQEAGVLEYWIVSPAYRRAYLFVRNAASQKFEQREVTAEGFLESAVIPGLSFSLEDFFAEERPLAIDILKRIDPRLI